MPVIGLTGGIASGKSTVAQRLTHDGAICIDADRISREMTETVEVKRRIAETFGSKAIGEDGELDRAYVARRIFANPDERAFLNAIIHPLVIGEMKRKTAEAKQSHGDPVIIWDVPLLIESGMHTMCDEVWVVTCPRDIREARASQRDGLSREAAGQRIDAQLSDIQRNAYADVLIKNDGTREELLARVDELYDNTVRKYEKNRT